MDSKERIAGWVETEDKIFAHQNDVKRSTLQEHVYYKEGGIVDTLGTGHKPKVILGVSGRVITTDMPTRSTPRDSEKPTITQAILGKSKPVVSPITISSVLDFLVRRSVSLERGRDLETHVERYSSRLPVLRRLKNPLYCSLRMLRDSSTTMKDLHSKSSSNRWRNWGIVSSGRCLTANITGFLRTGRECSLSDILEDSVDEKYFLSQRFTKTILKEIKLNRGGRLVLPSQDEAQGDKTQEETM